MVPRKIGPTMYDCARVQIHKLPTVNFASFHDLKIANLLSSVALH